MAVEVNREPRSRIPTGLAVYDRESDSRTQMTVVQHTDKPCDEVDVLHAGKTVADYNADYDPTLPAVTAIHRSKLDENVEDWENLPFGRLQRVVEEEGLRIYTYPSRRLK